MFMTIQVNFNFKNATSDFKKNIRILLLCIIFQGIYEKLY